MLQPSSLFYREVNPLETIVEKKIYIDFYNVVCTRSGEQVKLNNSSMSAFVRMKKTDGTYVFNSATIMNDGTISIELTSNMLSSPGKQLIDVVIISSTDVYLEDVNSDEELDLLITSKNISVISVMPFYLLVIEGVLNDSVIESSNEFSALVQATSKMLALEKTVTYNEDARQNGEYGELVRIANEKERIEKENERQNGEFGEAYRQANEEERKRNEEERQTGEFGEAYRQANEETRISDDTTRSETFDKKIEECETATDNAQKAADRCESVVDKTGIVLKENIVNTLTEEEEGKVLDATVGKQLNDMIASLQNTINNLHKVHYGTTEPDSNIGNDGDIYMMIIEEVV